MGGPSKKVWIISSIGTVITILGIITGSLWPLIYDWAFFKILVLSPSSISYNMWKETPAGVPMYMKFYMFNWTNPVDFRDGVKPHFEEMGPYVFREIDIKVDEVWNDNGTVTFQRKKVWFYDETLSNGSLSDTVTNLNPIATTVAFFVRHKPTLIRVLTNGFMVRLGEKLVITKTVKELLFDGYNDTLLLIAQKLKATKIPFSKFGWFYSRNESKSYDGTFNMFTGMDNFYDKGMVKEWNFSNGTDNYKEPCNVVNGSLGDLWPSLSNNDTASLFIPDICTNLKLSFKNTTVIQDVTGKEYIGDNEMLDNGTLVPSRQCYCPDGDCGPSGTLNISSCKFGAPAFVSMPHFYLADPSYRDAITGMSPNKERHELSITIEPVSILQEIIIVPHYKLQIGKHVSLRGYYTRKILKTTGIPLQVKAQLQINLLVIPVEHMTIFQNLTQVYVPMFWFSQEANLNADTASKIKLLLTLSTLGSVTCFGIAGIGILIFFIGLFTYIRQKWRGEENQVLLSKYDDGDAINKNGT